MEEFYFHLFSQLKTLAAKNTSYLDINFGNIIVRQQPLKLQLIDFGSSQIHYTTNEAVQQLFLSRKFLSYFQEFEKLNTLTESSKELILWFNTIKRTVCKPYSQPKFSTPRFNSNPSLK